MDQKHGISRTEPIKSGRDPEPLADEAKRILRAEMERRGFTYKRLVTALELMPGESQETLQAMINKVNRGRFSFAFMLRVCRAMGMSTLNIAPLPEIDPPGRAEVNDGRGK